MGYDAYRAAQRRLERNDQYAAQYAAEQARKVQEKQRGQQRLEKFQAELGPLWGSLAYGGLWLFALTAMGVALYFLFGTMGHPGPP